MIPIKIQCGCGQRYAFDVEAVDGRMPNPVACPVCGADGTPAANAVIAQQLQAEPAGAPAIAVRINRAAAPPAPAVRVVNSVAARSAPPKTAPVDHSKAETEARAKMMWGDEPQEVIKFLMREGVPHGEAMEIVAELTRERKATLRKDGLGKIFTGIFMACVPVAAWFGFARMGILPLKIFAVLVMVGLWGAWRILKGSFMVIAPSTATGDVAEQ